MTITFDRRTSAWADDFLASAAAQEEKRGGKVIVASGDRDSFQLASDLKECEMLMQTIVVALALVISSALAAAQSESDMGHGGQMMMKMQSGKEPSEADKGYMEAMTKMNQTMMSTEMTGDPSHDFVMMMIPHHQSAIDMAQVFLKEPNADAQIKSMAEKIISDQQKEIDQSRHGSNRISNIISIKDG